MAQDYTSMLNSKTILKCDSRLCQPYTIDLTSYCSLSGNYKLLLSLLHDMMVDRQEQLQDLQKNMI